MIQSVSRILSPGSQSPGSIEVFEETLENGLRLLVCEQPKTSIVYSDLFFPVGSVNDPPGQTGIAHFVEHMLFKGTRRLPKGGIDRLTFLAGGQANAETDEDTTHYWFGLPSGVLELALVLESDRILNARFVSKEVEAERRVIAEEARRELDQPWSRLERAHLAASYPFHPYRNPVLGWPEDLEQFGPRELKKFYRENYGPSGAVLVVVGGVEAPRVIERVRHHFEKIPRVQRPASVANLPQMDSPGASRLEFRESDSVCRGLLGWRTCARTHADSSALEVLAELLGSGRKSRLWKKLVDRDRRVTSIDASHEPSARDGLFYIGIESEGRSDPRRIEAEILAEISELAHRGPSSVELARVRERLKASWLWEMDDLGAMASGLGHAEISGDWRLWRAEYDAASAITTEDIRRVARSYLHSESLVAAWSLPQPRSAYVAGLAANEPVDVKPQVSGRVAARRIVLKPELVELAHSPPNSSESFLPVRQVLPTGMRLIGEARPESGVLAFEFYCDAGILRESKPGLAFLTARMREEGTRRRNGHSIAQILEQVGGSLEVLPAGISIRIGAAHLELAFELLADLIRRPGFSSKNFPWICRRIRSEIQVDREDPAYRASLEFLRQIYGRHPYGRDPRGTCSGLDRLTLDDVRKHQASFFKPERSFLVVTGDFSWPRLIRAWDENLGDWFGQTDSGSVEPYPWPKLGRLPKTVHLQSSWTQAHVVIGHMGVERTHNSYPALAILDHILGSGPGLCDRLSRVLRDELGLVYSVNGGMTDSADLVPGVFKIALACQERDVTQAMEAAERELIAVHLGKFSDREVFEAKGYLEGSWVFEYQGVAQRAERWLELERWGLPLDEPDCWPKQLALVTPEDVRLAARTHLRPDQLTRVTCGS